MKDVSTTLFSDIVRLITKSKESVLRTVNAELTILYWDIGNRIKKFVLKSKRAEYGKQIIIQLAQKLTSEFGTGWSEKNLRHCLYTAETFQDRDIISTLSRQLSWSHLKELMYIKDELSREFYIEMCKTEKWTVRTLRERIDSMLYERTAISKKPGKLIKQELENLKVRDRISPDLIFRDPYILDFLGLKDTYSEKDLESAIIAELQRFITELGSGFAFVARQKRIIIDNEDFCLDLVFYHRKLKCLVAIELKLGKFKAEYKSKMELYLKWLEKNEMQKGEKKPIGLILCTEGNKEQIELLELHKTGIRVSEYMTELPPKALLKKKLHQAVLVSRKMLETKTE